MRITSSINILSALLILLFASATVWTHPASGSTDKSKQTAVKKAQPKAHKKPKAAQRLKKVRFARQTQAAGKTLRAPTAPYSNVTAPGRTPAYNWSTAATHGGSVPRPAGQAIAPQAQPASPGQMPATAPQVQSSQVPATVCYSYNPCTTCWSVPYTYNPWAAQATYGGAPQPATAPPPAALPPAQPTQAPAGYSGAVQQPQAATSQTTVCYDASWWSTWPLSYLSGWCF